MKGSLFSRLFGSNSKPEAKQEPKTQVEPEIKKGEVPSPDPSPFRLNLSPEHAINRLWHLRNQQSGWLSNPEFILSVPAGLENMLPHAKAEQELSRLQLAVTMAANKRIAAVEPKNSTDSDPEKVCPDLDAQAMIFLSGDRMLAWLFAFPPVGAGKELDRAILENALEEKQVRYGLQEEVLDQIPQNPERYFHLFHIASGTPVENGKDGYIVEMFPRKPKRKLDVDENNRVDYKSINFVQNVAEGDVICQIVQPVPGVPGRTVLDQEIAAKEGKAAKIPKGRNTELSEDGEKLLATRTGNVDFNGRTFQVKPILEIAGNVDLSTGNLNFLGDIHIKGDIRAGFVVRAAGNVTVDGVVEASTVEAGGDVILVKGANGSEEAVLRAGGSLYAKFLENCCIYSKEKIHTDCIINCNVYCDGGIEVRSGRGIILGGSIRAAHEVSALVVGSRGEIHTDIILGGLPCQEFDQQVLIQEINHMEEELAQLEHQPDTPTKSAQIIRTRLRLSADRAKLEDAAKHLDELDKARETPGIQRLVCNIAYPGTSVTIGEAFKRFRLEVSPCTAVLVDGEICCRPY